MSIGNWVSYTKMQPSNTRGETQTQKRGWRRVEPRKEGVDRDGGMGDALTPHGVIITLIIMTKKNNNDGDDVERIRKCEEEDKGDNSTSRGVKTDTDKKD